ncbi:putative Transcription factor S-II (TFIIS), central domain containing protein [Blattamonas nauphoetae]|uniref:Transcription factor S-II (TFIIS), central domain containing protein n=1 Tax=Blattamonas nauphoetae TaxID=2049346 RepID=A0ABQ9YAI0_9EUKA|nr:putative Transcription factor S-II (TFIIS), central domain containing protein [Blattamonas nauphoetae]
MSYNPKPDDKHSGFMDEDDSFLDDPFGSSSDEELPNMTPDEQNEEYAELGTASLIAFRREKRKIKRTSDPSFVSHSSDSKILDRMTNATNSRSEGLFNDTIDVESDSGFLSSDSDVDGSLRNVNRHQPHKRQQLQSTPRHGQTPNRNRMSQVYPSSSTPYYASDQRSLYMSGGVGSISSEAIKQLRAKVVSSIERSLLNAINKIQSDSDESVDQSCLDKYLENETKVKKSKVRDLAASIEESIFNAHPSPSSSPYKDQVREVLFNLTDPKNRQFRQRVFGGVIPVSEIGKLDSWAMASDELQQERKEIEQKALKGLIIREESDRLAELEAENAEEQKHTQQAEEQDKEEIDKQPSPSPGPQLIQPESTASSESLFSILTSLPTTSVASAPKPSLIKFTSNGAVTDHKLVMPPLPLLNYSFTSIMGSFDASGLKLPLQLSSPSPTVLSTLLARLKPLFSESRTEPLPLSLFIAEQTDETQKRMALAISKQIEFNKGACTAPLLLHEGHDEVFFLSSFVFPKLPKRLYSFISSSYSHVLDTILLVIHFDDALQP